MGISDFFVDPKALPADGYGFVQLLTLLAGYGYVLFVASNLIADGSELLLLVPSLAGLVGSCVLPILGAVPDGAIVLFSGLGPDAQEQLSVGVGALAGSTIMLLTVPWCLSILGGRVNIDPRTRMPVYKRPPHVTNWAKLHPPGNMSLMGTGVLPGPNVKIGGYILLITAVSYLLIQGPAFFYAGQPHDVVVEAEHNWAVAGFVTCTVMFVAYLGYQYYLSQVGNELTEQRREEVIKEKIVRGEISLLGVMFGFLDSRSSRGDYETSPLLNSQLRSKLDHVLRPFFEKYDTDKSGTIELSELGAVFRDLKEYKSQKQLEEMFRKFDRDNSGAIDYPEFVQGVTEYVIAEHNRLKDTHYQLSSAAERELFLRGDEEEGEEEEEMPEDFVELPPEQQQLRIKFRAFWMMGLGTLLVILFSDPLVDVLSEVGARTNISPFYISFVFAPLASNASELFASFSYAQKKTTKTIEIALTTLEGAGCMNNTFCLGIFMMLIFTQGLAWEFSAETLSILFVEICIAAFAMKTTHTVLDAFCILALYPTSLFLVAGLEAAGYK